MLPDAAKQVVSRSDIVSTSGLRLQDIGEIHCKKGSLAAAHEIFGSPGQTRISLKTGFRLGPQQKATKWLIPLAAGLYQLIIR